MAVEFGQSYRQAAATETFLHDLIRHRDNQRVLMIAHTANRWALDCLLAGASLPDLLANPFDWRPGGWFYTLPKIPWSTDGLRAGERP